MPRGATCFSLFQLSTFLIENRLHWHQLKYHLKAVKKKIPRNGIQQPRRPVTRARFEMLVSVSECTFIPIGRVHFRVRVECRAF